MKNLLRLLPVLLLCASGAGEGVRAQERTLSTPDAGSHADASILALITAIEQTVRAGDTVAYLALHTESANRERALAFAASELVPGATRGVVRERDREALPGTLPGGGYRLIVDVFAEFGQRARAATWRPAYSTYAPAHGRRRRRRWRTTATRAASEAGSSSAAIQRRILF